MAEGVCFVDVETTGLHPDFHEIWEVGLITPEGYEKEWQLPVDLGRADSKALAIGRYHERKGRTRGFKVNDLRQFAAEFARETRGAHLAGACVAFDAERLAKLLRHNGACVEWNYHIVDVEALAAGWLARTLKVGAAGWIETDIGARLHGDFADLSPHPPWKSSDLSRAVGVDPDDFDRHTALGDAKWARAIYEAVMGRG